MIQLIDKPETIYNNYIDNLKKLGIVNEKYKLIK